MPCLCHVADRTCSFSREVLEHADATAYEVRLRLDVGVGVGVGLGLILGCDTMSGLRLGKKYGQDSE